MLIPVYVKSRSGGEQEIPRKYLHIRLDHIHEEDDCYRYTFDYDPSCLQARQTNDYTEQARQIYALDNNLYSTSARRHSRRFEYEISSASIVIRMLDGYRNNVT